MSSVTIGHLQYAENTSNTLTYSKLAQNLYTFFTKVDPQWISVQQQQGDRPNNHNHLPVQQAHNSSGYNYYRSNMTHRPKATYSTPNLPDSTRGLQPTEWHRSALVEPKPAQAASQAPPPAASFGVCRRPAHGSAAGGWTCHQAPRCPPRGVRLYV